MASSGGGTAQTAAIAHVEDTNRLLLLGADKTSGADWYAILQSASTKSYRFNPSAMEFILEYGTTQVGGNPFEGVDAYNPTGRLAATDTAFTEFRAAVGDLAPLTDWGTWVTQALADENTKISGVDIDSTFTASMSEAVTEAATAIAAAFTDATASGTLLTTASSAGSTITSDAATVADTEAEDTLDNADARALALVANMETVVSAEAEDLLDNASDEAVKLLPDMEAIVSTEAEDIVNNAIAVAENAVSNAVVSTMVTAYESRALTQHLRAVNRFSGGMADINAVNSSAFVIGMSLKESDFTRDVNEFQAKLEATLYEKGFDAFIGTAAETMRAYKDLVNSFLSTSAEAMKVYQNMVGLFTEMARNYLAYYIEAMKVRVAIYTDRSRAHGQIFRDLALEHIRTTMQVGQSVTAGAQSIGSSFSSELESRRAIAALLAEINRIALVAESEEQQLNLEYDTRYATWDMQLFQAAADIGSAVTGSVVGNVARPSRMQTALGGAMSGAAMGLKIGAEAAPAAGPMAWVAPLIGAGVGTIGGAIAGYQG